jgi:hypothetical protein
LDELDVVLRENGTPVSGETSATLAVPALTTEIRYTVTVPTLPADLLSPRELYEKVTGAPDSTFVPVGKSMVLPVRVQGLTLSEYVWEEQALKFVGATTARDLRILYNKGFPILTDPADVAQIIPYNNSGLYLSLMTSAYAAAHIDRDFEHAQVLDNKAQKALESEMNIQVRERQGLPVRRRGWTRNSRRRGRSIYRTR